MHALRHLPRLGLKVAMAAMLAIGAAPAAKPTAAGPTLLTPDQLRIDAVALQLIKDPAVRAARDETIRAWSALPAYGAENGPRLLSEAIDEILFHTARAAVERSQPTPSIYWDLAPPYRAGKLAVPSSRFGFDAADRIYRGSSVDPTGRYVLRGWRNAHPSADDFLFEATDDQLRSISALSARDIDVAADGSFTITIDATPTNGRRNHLYLPAGATGLLIRDTLVDWNRQVPNRLTIERVNGPGTPRRSARDELLAMLAFYTQFNIARINGLWALPPHELKAEVRSADVGVKGAILGTARFSLKDDEAFVVQIDPQGAGYTNLQLNDAWRRSIPYWDAISGRSDPQSKRDADGAVTYIISPRDPGYFNWLSTTGLHDGFAVLRIEKNAPQFDIAKTVRFAKVVKLADLPTLLPEGSVRVTAAERATQIRERKAGFARRLTD